VISRILLNKWQRQQEKERYQKQRYEEEKQRYEEEMHKKEREEHARESVRIGDVLSSDTTGTKG
jgi:hypothetical protein